MLLLTCVLVHLGVVDAEPAENGERLQDADVTFAERRPVALQQTSIHPDYYHILKRKLGIK